MFSSQNSQVSNDAVFVEDIFSTTLYTGNGSTQTITNGIDLSTYGGLTWSKRRDSATGGNHVLIDTVRGAGNYIGSNTTSAQATDAQTITAFGTTGYSIGTSTRNNTSAGTYASWTFRKQPKFFDVVTYTGNGVAGRQISHSLGSAVGCLIVKCTSAAEDWQVWHRTFTGSQRIRLNTTDAVDTSGGVVWNGTAPTSTVFTVGDNGVSNGSGQTYVAYLFAHDAGGFGLTGTDNVISCGSYTGTGSAQDINLGYEPQFLIIKNASSGTTNWVMLDNMRGLPVGTGDAYLKPNLSDAEVATSDFVDPTATGFRTILSTMNTSGNTFIYIAIRRGPMKVPTSGTSVFIPLALNNASDTKNTTGFPVDLQFQKYRAGLNGIAWFDRLRGLSSVPSSQSATTGLLLRSSSTAAEVSTDNLGTQYGNTSFNTGGANGGIDMIYWNVRRAPNFFDEVCYTGNGTGGTQITHNLGVAPELVIVKWRTGATGEDWPTMCTAASSSPDKRLLYLDLTAAGGGLNGVFADSGGTPVLPTSTVFTLGSNSSVNNSGATYVAYLFATCAGVSKVGSYTGTGALQTVNCGFAAGARFVLIKRTNSTGNWYVYDSARGITSGNDPYLLLNSTDSETTGTNYVDTDASGFKVTAAASATVNVSGGTYIFLAIA
jgi:hypothetical protein